MPPASPPAPRKNRESLCTAPCSRGACGRPVPHRAIHPLKLERKRLSGRFQARQLAPVLPRPMWSLGPGRPPRLGHCLTSTKGLGCTPRLSMCDVLGMTPVAQSRPLPLGRWGNGDGRPVSSGSRRPATPGLLSRSPRPSKAASDPIKSQVTQGWDCTWYPALQKLLDSRVPGSA